MDMIRHFTATAFVTDDENRALLMWHHKLNRWMPMGGHIDENELPEDAAKRECKEETGLDIEILGEDTTDLFKGENAEGCMLKKPFAMLLENIPEHGSHPAHQHMDFLFRAKMINPSQQTNLDEKEGKELKWFTRKEIEALSDEEIFVNVRRYVLLILGES